MRANTTAHSQHRPHSLDTTLIGAFVLGVLFVLCWITSAYGKIEVAAAVVRFFTAQPAHSMTALYQGLLWALVVGALCGALLGLASYLFRRRSQ